MKRGIRKRLKGWRLDRFIERMLYKKKDEYRKRKKFVCKRKYSGIWNREFVMTANDSAFVTEVKEGSYQIKSGNKTVVCPKGSFLLNIPDVLDFDRNYDETAQFISVFHRLLESGKRISYIGFENLKHISPACVTVFAAYADMWKRRVPTVQAWCETWHPEVENAFAEIGVFDMLNIKHEKNINSNVVANRRYMPIT